MRNSDLIKRKLKTGDWFLIIANLLPVYGVLFRDWDPKQIFIVYCLESIIIGFFTFIKLGITTVFRKTDWWHNNGTRKILHGLFFMFFFLIHYGVFVWIQLLVFLNITSVNGQFNPSLYDLISYPGKYLFNEAWLMFSVFVFSYGYQILSGFILENEYRTKPMMRIMFEPYIRIFIQQFTVLAGGFILALGAGKIFILIFAMIKIFFTVFLNYELALNSSMENLKTGNEKK